MDGQGTKLRRKIAENYNRLSRVHERYRRQTDDRRQTDGRQHSERQRQFTFAKNLLSKSFHLTLKHLAGKKTQIRPTDT